MPALQSASNKGTGKPSFWATAFRDAISMNIFLCTCSLRMDSHLPTNKFSTCTTKIGLSSLQPSQPAQQKLLYFQKLYRSCLCCKSDVSTVEFQGIIKYNHLPLPPPFNFTWQIRLLFRPKESVKSTALIHDEDLSWLKKKEKAVILAWVITKTWKIFCW